MTQGLSRIQQKAVAKLTLGAVLDGKGLQHSGSQSSHYPHGARPRETATLLPGARPLCQCLMSSRAHRQGMLAQH